MKNQTFIYGILGADENYRVARYDRFEDNCFGMADTMFGLIGEMLDIYPSIQRVFVIDGRFALKKAYFEAYKHNTMESWIAFKDYLERNGHEIYLK